jgi:16S rRNA (guanine527-N7)-methyltransferase
MTGCAPTPEFLAAAEALGVQFDAGDLEKLQRYLELLLETTARFNLTAVTEPKQAWMRHVLDALTLLPVLDSCEAQRIIDVGSGGGVPGVPLAISRPRTQVMLLEATGKKAAFLEATAQELALGNVEVLRERAEVAGQDHHRLRGAFDVVVARAVGPLPVLIELTVPLAREGGLVLAIKGAKAAQEIAASKAALHALHAAVIDTLPTPTGTIVVIEKLRKTPRIYPRAAGEPTRRPLGG